jgi:hypothetical protein
MMSITSKLSMFWASGGTVDAPVLGTGLARGGSSSLLSPTIGQRMDTMMDTKLYSLIQWVKKGVLVVQGFKMYVSLRRYRHFFFIAQVTNYYCVACVFLKNQSLHLCDSLVSNCIKTTVSCTSAINKWRNVH